MYGVCCNVNDMWNKLRKQIDENNCFSIRLVVVVLVLCFGFGFPFPPSPNPNQIKLSHTHFVVKRLKIKVCPRLDGYRLLFINCNWTWTTNKN